MLLVSVLSPYLKELIVSEKKFRFALVGHSSSQKVYAWDIGDEDPQSIITNDEERLMGVFEFGLKDFDTFENGVTCDSDESMAAFITLHTLHKESHAMCELLRCILTKAYQHARQLR